MKLSTRARYGTRALLELAMQKNDGLVPLKEIAERQQISLAYLEHLITPLVTAGIIRSTRGPKGGVSLARSPADIRLNEVVQLLEGSIAPAECIDNPEMCDRSGWCATRDVWADLEKAMNDVLGSTTLADLVNRQKRKLEPAETMYYI